MFRKTLSLGLLLISSVCFASVTASVDRDRISSDESFMLYISSDSVFKELKPTLDGLNKDFEIVGSSNSSQVSIINGKSTSNQQVMITLMPKHTGRLLIPAIKVGNDTTKPLYVTVLAATAIPKSQQKLFIETSITPKNSYPKAENIYTVKLYYALDNLAGNLSPPNADGLHFAPLGKALDYGITRGNKAFRVIERHYAVFADQPGDYKIPGIIFTGSAETQQSMNDLFQLTGGKPVRAVSPSVELHIVKPPVSLDAWLPAQQLSLTETWAPNPPQFKVGDPITRTLQVSATGLMANQLPDINVPNLPGMNNYPDQAVVNTLNNGNHIIGRKTFKIAYIPTQTGEVNFPAVRIRWWNTQTKQFQIAQLPAHHFNVQAGNAAVSQPAIATTTTSTPPMTKPNHGDNLWMWIAGLFFLAWLASLYFLWRRKSTSATPEKSSQQSIRQLRGRLKRSCHNNNPESIKYALIAWAKAQWPKENIQTLGEIKQRVIQTDLQTALRELDESLYHHTKRHIDGEKIWQAFLLNEPCHDNRKQAKIKPLPPLHLDD